MRGRSLLFDGVRHPHSDQISSPRSYFEADTENRAELTRLVIRAQADDLDAQSQLVRLYSHRIAGFLRTIVRDGNAIDDVTQVVFIKMVRRLNLLREPISFEAWLFAMARSTALDYLRSRRRRPELLADDPEIFDAADTRSPMLMSEITEALTVALSHLSPKDRTVVSMVVEGHSYQTIAAQEKLTLGAVKARLTRVRPFLRAAVGLATGTRLSGQDEERYRARTRNLAAA